jgi:nitrogenase molybdenum-iron protein beta chain
MNDLPLPIGIENTGRWIRAAAAFFDRSREAEELIARGESMVTEILRRRALMIIPRYRNCRVAISADATLAIPLVRTLYLELEMIPEIVLLKGSSPEARGLLERELGDLGISPLVVFDADGWAIAEALREREVDAVLGSSWERYIAEELGIRIVFDVVAPTSRDLYVDRPYFGYEGFLNLLEAMGNSWEEALRSKRIAWEQFEEAE